MYSRNCLCCNTQIFRKKRSEALRKNWKYCSSSCRGKMQPKPETIEINCLICNKKIIGSKKDKVHLSRIFCSKKCSTVHKNIYNNPLKRKEVRDKISKLAKIRGTFHMLTKESIEKRRKSIMGSKHWNWQNGKTETLRKIRNSFEYKKWREAVFERDNYTCIWCAVRSGNGKALKLNADHIKPFALFPELRFELDNGRTLCENCHRKTDTWGGKIKSLKKIKITCVYGRLVK